MHFGEVNTYQPESTRYARAPDFAASHAEAPLPVATFADEAFAAARAAASAAATSPVPTFARFFTLMRSAHAKPTTSAHRMQRLTAPFDSLKLSTNRKSFVSGD